MAPQDGITTYLFTQGVLGVLCIALGAVCIKLYKKVEQLQDARLADSKEVTKEVTAVVSGNTNAMNLFSAKINNGKGGEA